MINFNNLTEEEKMKVNILAGSAMAGFFRGAGIALTFGGAAIKTTTEIAAAVLNKSAEVIESAGENGGNILIGLGESADKKADEYSDAVNFCKKLLNENKQPEVEIL